MPSPRPSESAGLFSPAEYAQVRAFFDARPRLQPTPTRHLPALADHLGLGAIFAKDETARFGLNAFKLLGGLFAIETLIAEGAIRPGDTLVCASEGNHGRAVARAARDAGCQSRVYMAGDAAAARVAAIAGEGAEVVRVDGSYDDAVRIMRGEAADHRWTIVSDTSWEGYERIPRLIVLGYTRMIAEISERFDVVFVQGGVGGLLCGVASACVRVRPGPPPRGLRVAGWRPLGTSRSGSDPHRPNVVCVEPSQAACLMASAQAGHPVAVDGPLSTSMAGLRNREVSPLAFEAVQPIVDAYVAIDDQWAHDAMRRFARPAGDDPAIAAGASGSAALGGLLAVCTEPTMAPVREHLRLGPASRVLVIVSEGVTDPQLRSQVMDAQK
ncbi:MAG: pyridoxal-phosphate dependent enzyme [Acidobacteriota bacterium]|nr:pyridoxal-phosphate dependent enzyme [Acidobacteriota bacterium]